MAKFFTDDFQDNFTESVEPPKPKEPDPEQLAREREEREEREKVIERRYNKPRIALLCLVAVAVVTLVVWLLLYFFAPVKKSQERGVIMEIAIEGAWMKTYEGKMMSERVIDSTHVYQTDFPFSVTSDSVAALAARLAGTGRRVTVKYDQYSGLLPWRGSTRTIVTAIIPDDSVFTPLPVVEQSASGKSSHSGKK